MIKKIEFSDENLKSALIEADGGTVTLIYANGGFRTFRQPEEKGAICTHGTGWWPINEMLMFAKRKATEDKNPIKEIELKY